MVIVLGRTVLQARSPEAGDVHGQSAVAAVITDLPAASACDRRFPVGDQLSNRPSASAQGSPGTPDGSVRQTHLVQTRNDRSTTEQQLTADHHP